MPIVEEVAGTFLLQEMKAEDLHGALTLIISGPDKGWVLVSLSPSGPAVSCDREADRVSMTMDLDIALRFAGTLLLLGSVHLSELREDRGANIGDLEIVGSPAQKVMSWTSAAGSEDIKIALDNETIEVRLRCSLAVAIAFRILRQSAQLSAP